jgi:NAD(P)-dependent dehydrogenase (short-subunit alcohol dehydrogenase family)
MDAENRVVLITGGAGGIGKALAARFLKAGARVALWDADAALLDAACGELSALGPVRGYALDLTDRAKVRETAERVEREVGPVDILDNNAGIVFGADFLTCPEEKLLRTIDVNVNAVMWCTRAFLPGMIRRGRGHVVMMASAAGLLGVPGMAAYSASKHAVIGLAESIRLELRKQGHRGVGMTIVCPSFVATGMFEGGRPPKLVPWLSPDALAGKIFDAVSKDRLYVREPFLIKLLPALKGLCGTALQDWVGEVLGMHAAMDHWTGRRPSEK